MDYVITTSSLCKKYKNKSVLSGVNLNVAKGDVYGFVGENGSGKTTVIRLLCGLIAPSGGNFCLFGVKNDSPDILTTRSKIGAIVESPSIYLNMSAFDNLKMQATILGIKDLSVIKSALNEVGLGELYDDKKRASDYSLGMRQRLGIAMVLIGNPELIILDEPMNGLDPVGIVEIRELILRLNKEKGITFLISSHILTELELVATKYGVISKGKIIKEITSEELKNECRNFVSIKVDDPDKAIKAINDLDENICAEKCDNGIKVYDQPTLNQIFSALINNQVTVLEVNTSNASIEDYYLSLIGGYAND